ncbi:MAG: hypothetical protein HQM03_05860 [Magnetococcales bacterium]|nr:hypothetical protein [Magnetococcales bacterium]
MNMRMFGVAGMAAWMALGAAWAADAPPGKGAPADKEEQFKAHKASMVKMLEERLACIKAANSPADVKQCNEAHKARQQGEQLKRIQEQRKKLDDREKVLKDKQGGTPTAPNP